MDLARPVGTFDVTDRDEPATITARTAERGPSRAA